MKKPGFLTYAASFAPGLFQTRRTTWVALGVGLLVLFGLLLWSAVALLGWLWGQAQNWAGTAPEAVGGAVRGVLQQVEQLVPGDLAILIQSTNFRLDAFRIRVELFKRAIKVIEHPHLSRMQGADLGPTTRYPGLTRTHWQRDGGQATVAYEGKADYATVLDHYAKGFAAQGFAQTVQSATPVAETHEYTKGGEHLVLKITQKPRGDVNVRIEALKAVR